MFVVALFVALIVKKLEDEERSEIEKHVKTLAKNESWLHDPTLAEKEKTSIFDRIDTETAEPPNKDKVCEEFCLSADLDTQFMQLKHCDGE